MASFSPNGIMPLDFLPASSPSKANIISFLSSKDSFMDFSVRPLVPPVGKVLTKPTARMAIDVNSASTNMMTGIFSRSGNMGNV